MKKIWDIAFNDMLHNFRSLFALGMTFVAPLLVTGLIFFAFGGLSSGQGTGQVMKVAIVNLDQPAAGDTSMSQPLVDMFKSESVAKWIQPVEMSDESSALSAVNHQQVGVALIIPAGFSQVATGGKKSSGTDSAQIQIIQDPTLTTGPAIVKNMVGMYLDGINGVGIMVRVVNAASVGANGQTLPPDRLLDRIQRYQAWFTDFQRALNHTTRVLETRAPAAQSGGTDVAAPASGSADSVAKIMCTVLTGMMLFFAFYTGAYSMMSILREDEQGTLARMFTTPTPRTVVLAGKFLSVFLMVLVQALVMVGVGSLAFRIDWGRPLSVAVMIAGQVLAAGGLGVLLISLVKTSRQAGVVLGGGLTLLGMLGGLFTSSVEMPEAFTRLAVLTPQGWAIKGWSLVENGAALPELSLTLAALAAMGVVMFAIGAVLFRRRFA
jgi:ABC-2 type transport system permease protein